MNERIVDSPEPITLVGGGAGSAADLDAARAFAPRVVAVDGGADLCAAVGVTPDALLGDLDSVSDATRGSLSPENVYHVPSQDDTDLDKTLARVAAPLMLGVGFLGGRLDHQLAALHSLLLAAHQPLLLIGAEDVICLCPPELSLDLPAGTRLSMFPLAPVQGWSIGLKWPIDGLALAPGRMIATSNETTGQATLWIDAPGVFLITPRDTLQSMVTALRSAAPWPARERQYRDPPRW